MAAFNSLSCANMALPDYDHLISLDEVIVTMYVVDKSIPNTLRCTNLGGLSITKTAKEIEQKLAAKSIFNPDYALESVVSGQTAIKSSI